MPIKHILRGGLLTIALVAGLTQCTESQGNLSIVGLSDLQAAISGPGEQVKVINFWATWCGPCIKEMPLFEELNERRPDVEVMLVSLDLDLDPDPEKVRRFVKQREIKSRVMILDAGNPNEWIDKIDPGWSGALPATLVVNSKTGKRVLAEKELHAGDLEELITQVQ